MITRLALTLVAIAVLAALAWWLGLGRDRAIPSAEAAMQAAGHALPGFEATGALVGRDGRAAIVAGANGRLAVLKQHGAHFAARDIGRDALTDSPEGTLVDTGERRFGRVLLAGVGRDAIARLSSH